MANYEHTTREVFRELVQQKLGEDGVHWTATELNSCIEEALLTFGALSGFWKDEVFFLTEENKVIYNFFEDATIGKELIEPSLKYKNIIDWLNRDLLESINFAQPISEFFSLSDFIGAIKRKYNQFQQLTNLITSVSEQDIPANQQIVNLSSDVIDIIRISYIIDGIETILDEADEASIGTYSNYYAEVSNPLYYTTVYGATKELKLFPIPANVGKLKIIYISAITQEPNDENVVINICNNLLPYIKFGVEADLFSNEGVMHDIVRAAYCKQRWEEGILVARNYTTALLAKVNASNQINIDSMYFTDIYSNNMKVRTPPTIIGFGGLNIFRTDVIPSAVQYSIEILSHINAPLPITDEDFIKIDLEYVDILADYVVHLAKFRNGASEVALTNNLKDNFLKHSVNHNRRLLQAGITFDNLLGIVKKQEMEQPRIPIEQ